MKFSIIMIIKLPIKFKEFSNGKHSGYSDVLLA